MEFETARLLAGYAFIAIVLLTLWFANARLRRQDLSIILRISSAGTLLLLANVLAIPAWLLPADDEVLLVTVVQLSCTVGLLIALNVLDRRGPSSGTKTVGALHYSDPDTATRIIDPKADFFARLRLLPFVAKRGLLAGQKSC